MASKMISRTANKASSSLPSARARPTSTGTAFATSRHGAHTRSATLSYQARAHRKQQQLFRSVFAIAVAGGLATVSQYYSNNGRLLRQANAEAPEKSQAQSGVDEENALTFEQSRKKAGVSKEENRDLISSQHHQVKRSWESPGVYAWGSNAGRVVAPDSEEAVIKTPRRIAYFDGKLLRDIKLDRNFGAAIDEHGNLLQWGVGYKPDTRTPEVTLKGKNLVSLAVSKDRVLGLSKDGTVYNVPVSAAEQLSGPKTSEASWFPFWRGQSRISYRIIAPKGLSYSDRITSVSSGLEHAILLTSSGRVFSAASASESFPERGQLGIPGLTWLTRPAGAYDQPHEIITLRGFHITKAACGDYHSLVLDQEGRVFSWGDNTSGQLGFDFNPESSIVDAPSLMPMQKLYAGSSQVPRITHIAAGGSNSYFTVDATRVASPSDDPSDPRSARQIGRVTADTFAFGSGILGNLANNRWTHIQSSPSRIPNLSGLFEYDEKSNTTVPIRLAHLTIGATHAAAVMDNITYVSASANTSSDDTNWGADIVFWGGNEHYQLGTGKRNNVSTPVYIQPLDIEAEVKRAKKSSGAKEEHRFHITPRTTARLGDGRRVSVEQRVECGRHVTCVYSGT